MNKNYQYILFDLDGTLTDPKIGITKSVQYALAKKGIKETNLDKLEPFIGPPLIDSFREFYGFNEKEAEELITFYREYFSVKGMYENIPYDGIKQLLKKLKENNKTLIIATSKPTVFADKILEYFQMQEYFDLVVGSNLDGTRIHKEEIIEYIIQCYPDIDSNNAIMVGDRKYDVEGAKANNLEAIGVAYGYGGKEELLTAKAARVVNTVDDLSKALA